MFQVNKRLSDIISQPTDDAKQAALAMAMYDIAKVENKNSIVYFLIRR